VFTKTQGEVLMPDDEKTRVSAPSVSDRQGWREIAEKASKEKDPYTLLKLVQQLCDKIDEQRGSPRKGARTVMTASDNDKPTA
jgi:hypothetical protein